MNSKLQTPNSALPTYDVIIIGSGPAGLAAAIKARSEGAGKVAVIESATRLGGECPNRGCVPTKTLLRSAEVLHLARRAEEFGLRIPEAEADFAAVMGRKRAASDSLSGGGRLEGILGAAGVEVIRGHVKFVSPRSVDVGGRIFESKTFIVATGTVPFVPPIDGLIETGFWTSDDAIAFETPPKSLIILGGGPIGCEIASYLNDFGTDVTVVEAGSHILGREDAEIAAEVTKSFDERGIRVLTDAQMKSVRRSGQGVIAEIFSINHPDIGKLKAETVMIVVGKRPAVADLDLDRADVRLNERGMPILDPQLRSTNEAIYFAGDVAGGMMFTNVAHEMGEIAAENAVSGSGRTWDAERVVPRGTFCRPEVGSVGLTEDEARKRGFDVAIGRAAYGECGKALLDGEPGGLVKLVVDRKSGLLLGGHIVGPAAPETVHELALAIHAGIPVKKIAEMIHAYPTYVECLRAAASGV